MLPSALQVPGWVRGGHPGGVALHGLGLPHLDHGRLLGALPGGERSRPALAATPASAPELLLLDEPTNDLDTTAGCGPGSPARASSCATAASPRVRQRPAPLLQARYSRSCAACRFGVASEAHNRPHPGQWEQIPWPWRTFSHGVIQAHDTLSCADPTAAVPVFLCPDTGNPTTGASRLITKCCPKPSANVARSRLPNHVTPCCGAAANRFRPP